MLLFDENLSPDLPRRLADLFPGSAHVHELGLGASPDVQVWEEAKDKMLAVVSKDSDLYYLSLVKKHPPKVIVLRLGNCSTRQVEDTLRRNAIAILEFLNESDTSTLILP